MTRMLPNRYLGASKPLMVKRAVSSLAHISAPLKGLSLSSKLTTGDPLTATVLDNFVIEENQIRCRAGTRLHYTYADTTRPVEALVPFYGEPNKLAAAIDGKLILLDGAEVHAGFGSNDWSWTSFSNLSEQDYTVMVNGNDGVWSWNGGTVPDGEVVPVIVIDNLNPVRVTVAVENIGKFANGQTVVIAGGVGEWAFVNGPHVIGNVGGPVGPNSFELVGVDGTVASIPQVGGVTAVPPGSMTKEPVTAPATAPWVVPDQFDIVITHMNRLWFADKTNLAVYYLPLQQKSGAVKVLSLNAVFRRGGSIRAMYTWTTGDGGVNLDDRLVVFSTNGEAVIYGGTDPDSDFELTGIFRFDAPLSKRSVVNYGGELYVLISTGMVPMSTLMRAESEKLGKADQNVFSLFSQCTLHHRDRPGYEAFLNPSSGRIICNMPQGGSVYKQVVRFMPNPIWATWSNLASRCWGWVDNRLFFGTDDGRIMEMHPNYLNDAGRPIRIDVQPAWGSFGTPAAKHFKMVLPYLITDGAPRPFIDMKVDYDTSEPTNQPDVTYGLPGSDWDTATWDLDSWASGAIAKNNWTGVGVIGRVGAPRLVALISNCEFMLTGWDVLYEKGSIFG